MNKLVRAIQTTMGEYGFKHPNDLFVITASLAEELEERGIVQVISDTDEPATNRRAVIGMVQSGYNSFGK